MRSSVHARKLVMQLESLASSFLLRPNMHWELSPPGTQPRNERNQALLSDPTSVARVSKIR